MPRQTNIKPRRGTAAQWALQNPILDAGEMGLETDTKKFKFGDGVTTWNSLAYASSGPGEPAIAPGLTTQFWRGDKTWQVIENPVRSFSELQTAVAAGGTIRVDNNYPITITSTVNVTTPCHIIGGEFIMPTDAAYNLFHVTSDDVTFDTNRFTGAGTTASPVLDTRFIDVFGTSANPVRNVRIRSCTMNGSQYENVRFTWTTHSSVTDCTMDDFLYAGVMIVSGSDIKVIGNTITNGILKSPLVNVYGIAFTDIDNTQAARCKNISIIGNTVRHIEWEGIDTHGGLNSIIQGNIVTGCNRGIALVVGNSSRVTVPNNNVVDGNYIELDDAVLDREGICLFGLSGNLADATITNNIIHGYSTNPIYLDGYVEHKKTIIYGNTVPHRDWTPIVMNNTSVWTANSTYVPEYRVEGKEVFIRGMAVSMTTSVANSRIGAIPASFAPNTTTFMKASLGSNAAASSNVIAILSNGEVWSYYKRAGDMYSYPLEGSYIRNIDMT